MTEQVYHVTPKVAGFSKQRAVMRVLYMVGVFATVRFLFDFVWPGSGSQSVVSSLLNSVGYGILFALIFFFAFLKPSLNYDLIVSDESISRVGPWFDRSVGKHEVRTITETGGSPMTPPGLRVSKFGRFGTFLWGFVWVPKGLPEYERIKALAESWRT